MTNSETVISATVEVALQKTMLQEQIPRGKREGTGVLFEVNIPDVEIQSNVLKKSKLNSYGIFKSNCFHTSVI